MLNRVGKDAIGRSSGSKRRSTIGRRPVIESLEGRAMMTATIAPIANVSVPQFQGYQVPVEGGTTHQQTYTVTSDNPGVKATVAQGQFLTLGVSHTSSGTGDVAVNGTMTFQLFQDLTPNTVASIESLITGTATNTTLTTNNAPLGTNYYVNKNFHRIANGFPDANSYIVQGGSLNGQGGGQVFKTPFPDEFNQSVAFTGTGQLAMANSGADTNDSQFFITTGSPTFLDYHHTIFGQIVAGQNILTQLTQISKSPTDGTTPVSPVTITSATLSPVSPDGVIHLDTTVAPANATANITVTAKDVTDNTTTTQTFQANVTPANTAIPERPFVGPYDQSITIPAGQTDRLQIFSVSATPNDPLTYTLQSAVVPASGTTPSSFTPVDSTKLTASVNSATGLVTITPVAGFTGTTQILIGVRDNTNRAAQGVALDSPDNYEYHLIQVNVPSSTTPVAQRPLSQQQNVTATAAGSTPIQLSGTNPNPNATATLPLTYAITTQPTHGTLSGFNASTGALNYTPTAGYVGPDAIAYTVTDPNSGLSSFATTVNVNVVNANTGAVRFFANSPTSASGVLVVTPVPRTDGGTNLINAAVIGGNVHVTVNGVLDAIQPAVGDVDRLVIYGSKANDTITVDPSLSAIATLDGGHGGINVLTAGSGQTREHGWFGKNTLVQGSSSNYQLGRSGIGDRFVKGAGTTNVIFLGQPGHFARHLNHNRQLPTQTHGRFYKFAANGKTLVVAGNPYNALRAPRTMTPNAPSTTGSTSTTTTRTVTAAALAQRAAASAHSTSTPVAGTTPSKK